MFAARHLFSEQITVCIAFPSPSTPSAGHPGHINIRNYAPNTTVFFHLCRALARGRICPSDNFLFDRSTAGCPQSAPSQSLSLSEVVSSGIGRRRRQEGLHRAAHDAWPASEMHGCLGLLKQGCISSAGQHHCTECQPPAMYGTTTGFRNLYRTLQWLPLRRVSGCRHRRSTRVRDCLCGFTGKMATQSSRIAFRTRGASLGTIQGSRQSMEGPDRRRGFSSFSTPTSFQLTEVAGDHHMGFSMGMGGISRYRSREWTGRGETTAFEVLHWIRYTTLCRRRLIRKKWQA